MTKLLCALRTPQDDRFSASGVATFQYLPEEDSAMIKRDAKDIIRNGQTAIDTLLELEIIKGTVEDGCFVPEGFPVTVQHPDGTVTVVR